jgi:hypothetical protein
MFSHDNSKNHSNMGQLVPGYAFYDNLGNSLAEVLVNLVENLFALVAALRR